MRTHIEIEIPLGYTSHECLDLIARGLIELQRAQFARDAREARGDARHFARIIRMPSDNYRAQYIRAFRSARAAHRDALRAMRALPVAESIGEDAPTCAMLAQQFAAMSGAHYYRDLVNDGTRPCSECNDSGEDCALCGENHE